LAPLRTAVFHRLAVQLFDNLHGLAQLLSDIIHRLLAVLLIAIVRGLEIKSHIFPVLHMLINIVKRKSTLKLFMRKFFS
jgi:hypothetical protein